MLGGRVEAGSNFNVVPDSFYFTIDRRINPEENFDTEKQRLHEILEGLEVETVQEGKSAATSETDPLSIALARNIEKVTGKPPSFEMCPGLLETRFYASRGIPALAYGPGLLTVSHGPNEFVPVRNLVDAAAIYAFTAAEVLGG
jgi:acetylornithine deacetylase/succinyl-diaminopimelate desuccinylase-like protein